MSTQLSSFTNRLHTYGATVNNSYRIARCMRKISQAHWFNFSKYISLYRHLTYRHCGEDLRSEMVYSQKRTSSLIQKRICTAALQVTIWTDDAGRKFVNIFSLLSNKQERGQILSFKLTLYATYSSSGFTMRGWGRTVSSGSAVDRRTRHSRPTTWDRWASHWIDQTIDGTTRIFDTGAGKCLLGIQPLSHCLYFASSY